MSIVIIFKIKETKSFLLQDQISGEGKPGREIWHSPVIQANWEARTVGWLEAERSPPPAE